MEQNNKNKEQTSFKIFDKVLVRNSDEHKWRPAIFARTRIGESPYKYNALLLCTGHVGDFIQCIPYKGNEKLAFTTAPFLGKQKCGFYITSVIMDKEREEDKAKALFRDPSKADHLQWLLEHRNA